MRHKFASPDTVLSVGGVLLLDDVGDWVRLEVGDGASVAGAVLIQFPSQSVCAHSSVERLVQSAATNSPAVHTVHPLH